MTKTHRIKGKTLAEPIKDWPYPAGKCDMCNKKKAKYWFGNTSVALCGDAACAEKNERKWQALLEEINEADNNSF